MRINPNTSLILPRRILFVLTFLTSVLFSNYFRAQCQVANAGPSRTLCVGSIPVMAANTATGGGLGTWTKISGSGVITNSSLPNTTITGLTAGISVFAWTITNGTCTPSTSNVTFTVGPSTAVAGPNQTVCATVGSANLAGNSPAVGTGLWVKVSGSGTITNPTQNNSTITGLTTGTTVLTWSVSFSSCASSVSNMTIVTKAPPTAANAGPSQTLCATTGTVNATLAGNAPTVGSGIWVLVSGTGTITNPLLRNTTVTNISPGQTVLTWSITNLPCASSVSNVTINVNAPTSIAAAGPNQTVCISSGAILAANTPTAGNGIWTVVTGTGTVVNPTNPTSAVTGLSVGNNDFRWTITNPPCAATTDVIRIVGRADPTIANAGPNQTICATIGTASTFLAGNAPSAGTGIWVIVSGSGTLANPLLRNSGLINISPGVTVLTWSISNPPCSPSTSNVTITVNSPPSVSAAGPDQTVCVSSAATMAANTSTAGSGIWTLISGSGTITTPTNPATTITGLGVGNNVFRWTTSNPPCASSNDNVTIVGRALPSIASAGGDQTVCVSTGSTTLAGNTPTAGVGAWIKVSGPGTITNSLSQSSTLTGLTAGTTVLTWSISNSPCAASVDNVTITTNALPSVAAAGSNQTVCTSTGATMAANTPAVGTGSWTLISGTGTITSPTSPATAITGLGVGANVFRWTISNPPCANSISNVTITGVAPPSISNAGSNQTLCASSPTTVMSANTPTAGTGVWTLISGAGTITNSLSATTSITGLGIGTNVFVWTIGNAPCASSSSTVSITVNALPTTANAGSNQTLCISSPTTTMNANTAIVGIGSWSLISGSGTITNSLSPTTSITGLAIGTNIFQWTISNSPCAPSVSTVAIVVSNVPTIANAGSNQTLCISSPNATMNANPALVGTGTWSLISGSGTITNSLSPTTSITGLGLGANVFAWTISNAPCPSSTSNVTLTVNQVPTLSNAGSNQTLCASSPSTTMNGNFPLAGTGAWTLISGTGVITNSLLPTTAVTGLGVGNNIFAWTITNAPCAPSVSNVTITVNQVPTVANAGPNQTLCASSPTTIMNANTAVVGTGAWTLVSGSGIITNSLSPTTSITGLGTGVNVFSWTISNLPCAPSVSNVTITVNQIPSSSSAGSNQTLCISSPSTTMNGNFPVVGTGAWTLVSGSGVITNSLLPNTSVTGLGVGNNVFAWTISNNPCPPSTSNVTITVNQLPTTSNAGPNQTLCITNPNTAMAANSPAVGTGTWTLISGSGTITNSLSPGTTITGLGIGANVFAWTISNSPCIASSSNVTVTVNQNPTVASAGSNQTLCISSPTASMNGNFPLIGTGAWTLVSGTGVITNSLIPNTTVTGLGIGTNVFQWTISNAPCIASSATVAIVVNNMPTAANAGASQTLCISSPNTIMAANAATVGTGVWTLVSGIGTITNSLSPTTSITGLGLGNNVFAWTISNAPCAPSVSNVTITVRQIPTIANAGTNQTLCISSPSTTMNGNTAVTGTGAWTLVSGSGTMTNLLSPTTSITGLGLGANVFAWTISNAPCSPSTSNVTITVNQMPTVANAGTSQTLCISSPNTIMAANTPVTGTGAWALISGSGTITNSLSPTTSITGLGLGVNVFAWTISNAPCAPSVSNVTITVRQVPTTAFAGSNQTLCISSPSTSMTGNTPAVGTGSWTLVSGTGSITNPTLANTTITGLGLGNNVFAWTISNNPCTPSTSNVTITVNQIPTVANAGSSQTLCISNPNAIMAANPAVVGTGSWSLVSGSGTITNSLSPTTSITGLGLGTNIFEWTISNPPCASSSSTVALIVKDIPTISNAGPNQIVCFNVPTATMSANAPTVGTGAWTLVSGTGIISNSLSPTTPISGLGIGTNVFAWTISNAPCASSVSNMTILVNPGPTISNAGPGQTVCISSPSAVMAANVATSGTGQWTLVSGTGLITNSLSPNTSVTGLGLGTNVFAWTIYDNPCIPSSSTVAIIVNDIPTIANAGSNQTVCITSPNAVMAANTPTVGTGAWTLVSGGGTITNSLSPTTSITGMPVGVNVFAWTISNNPCAASVSTVSIRVRRVPSTSVAGPNQTLCITNPNTVMAANTPTTGTGVWTLISGSGTITNSLSPTTSIIGLGLGQNVFAWTISNSPCVASSSNMTITVNDIPSIANAGTTQTLCISTPTTVMSANTATVGTGTWSLISGSGTITNSLSPTTSIIGLGLGTNIFEWTISNPPCTSSSSTVALIVNDVPTISNAGPSQTICISWGSTIMAANSPAVGTGSWTLISGSGSISNPSSPTTSIFGLGIGTNVFAWTISNPPCANSTSTVAIEVKDLPTVSVAGTSQTLCISSPSAIMAANTATIGTGAWTLISGSGTITNSISPTTSITGLGLGTNVFQWTISNSPCASSSSTVSLEVKDVPTISNAGASQTLCITSNSTAMTANTPTVGTGLWTLVSGTGFITNPNQPNTTITGLGLGTNIFQWTISNSPCATSSSTMMIQVQDIPTIANAGITQTLCISSPTANMTANTPTVGTGVWTLLSGTGTITNSLSPTTLITGLGLGTNIFQWTISNSPCASSSSTVALIVNDVPTVANAGFSQTICITSPNAFMNANAPVVGTGTWSLISGSGTITNSLSPTTSVMGLGLGLNVLEWTISNPPCAPSTSTVSILVNDIPTVAFAGTAQVLCISNPTTTMSANTPTTGTGLWTLVSGSGVITSPTSPTTTIVGLGLGTNVFQWTISNPPCLASSATVILTVRDMPTVSNAGPSQTLCITSPSTTMAANTPTVGTGVWTLISGGGIITNPTSPNTTITGLGLGANIFEWAISNSPCMTSVSTMTIYVDDKPTPANAGVSQNLCASTFTLAGNNPLVGTGLWTVIAGGSSVTTPTLNISTVTSLMTGTNTLVWTITNGVCSSSSGTVNLYVNPFPTPADAGVDQTICTNSTTLNGNTPLVGFGIWTVVNGGGAITTNTISNSTVTGLTNGVNTFVWTTAFGTCPNSPDTVVIMVDSLPTISLAGTSQTLCSTTATLSANIPTVGVGTWSVITGGSTVTTPTLNSSGITGLATGNNIFEWSISNGVCPVSTSTVSIFVDSYPTAANAGSDFTVCASTATLNSNIPTIGTGAWSVIAGGASVTSPITNTSSVTGLTSGTNSLVWTTSNGTCPSSMDTVNIQVDDFASPVSAGPDQAFCFTTTSANLNASIPSIGIATWSVMTGGGTLANPNSNTSTISGLTTGINTIVWTNTNGVCPTTSDTVIIELLMSPTPANAGPDQILCPNSTVLAGNSPSIGVGTWSVSVGAGSIASPTVNTSGVTSLATGTNNLVWTTSNGDCPVSSDTVQIIVLPPVQQAFAGNDTTIYVTSLNINANLPLVGTGQWQFVGGSYTIGDQNQNSTQLTNLHPGVNTIKWTITETCGSTSDELNIYLVILEIPNAFSPNGDGVNDYFEIPIADYYGQVEVKIVNRWGNVEFEDHNYKNTWNGVNQSGAPLTEDTYFYVVKLDGQVKTGYVLIKR